MTNSHHPESLNIHGQSGCWVRDDSLELCSGCCQVFQVEPSQKPAHQLCEHADQGCQIHAQDHQPRICQTYHCQNEIKVLANPLITDPMVRVVALDRILSLLTASLELGEIDQREWEISTNYWLNQASRIYSIADLD